MRHSFNAACLAATFATAAVCGPAHAGSFVTKRFEQNGAGACQGALPAFAGTLRARPLALQNEGGSTAFVTCSLRAETLFTGGVSPSYTRIRVFLSNVNETAQPVSCTLVDGTILSTAVYVVKSTTVSPGFGELAFELSDYPTTTSRMQNPNLSCSLAPGVGVGLIWSYVTE